LWRPSFGDEFQGDHGGRFAVWADAGLVWLSLPGFRWRRGGKVWQLLTDGGQGSGLGATLAIRNAGENADMKVIILNKLTAKRKVKCLEILHYA
jgi:hypothetical protein